MNFIVVSYHPWKLLRGDHISILLDEKSGRPLGDRQSEVTFNSKCTHNSGIHMVQD